MPEVRDAPPPARKSAVVHARKIAVLLLQVSLVLFALSALRSSIADQYLVPTSSMAPTIRPGDRIFVDKMAYDLRAPFYDDLCLLHLGEPRRGDLVIFLDPRDGQTTLVKRVVALPGQTVAMHGGVLYVDGVAQQLSKREDGEYIECLGDVEHESGSRDLEAFGPAIVPPGELFVMGDNRPRSYDSRFMGPIPRELVRGKVDGVVYHYDDDTGAFDASRLLHALR